VRLCVAVRLQHPEQQSGTEDERRQQHSLPDRRSRHGMQNAHGDGCRQQGEHAEAAECAEPPVSGLGDPSAGSCPEQHREQSESEQGDRDDHGRLGTGEPEREGGVGIQRERDVCAVTEQPDIHRAPPEDQPVRSEPELGGPHDGERDQRDGDADRDGEHGLEGREEHCEPPGHRLRPYLRL
jgi:hypothetical protein